VSTEIVKYFDADILPRIERFGLFFASARASQLIFRATSRTGSEVNEEWQKTEVSRRWTRTTSPETFKLN